MSWKRACLGMLALLIGVSTAEAQQTRIITGTVKESVTNEAVAGAAVIVKGTSIGALTELDGSFTLAGVPLGDVIIEVTSAVHQALDIPVAANQGSIQVELQLVTEQIVVTGRAPSIFRQNLNNGASVVKGDSLVAVPQQTVDSALQGKIAGANIQSNSGAPGGGIQMRLRGVSTIQGRSVPLYVVDGVIVSDTAIASGANIVTRAAAGSNASNQDNPVNRIADLNPNDIESIEVLKGASAAALYGSKASNGVVIITTKRGRAGKPQVTITQRLGFAQVSNTLGSRTFETEAEAIEQYGEEIGGLRIADLYAEENGNPISFDHEQQLMQSKLARETSASLSGGSDKTRYLVSTSLRDEPGILIGTGYEKQTARLALDQDFGNRLKLSFTGNILHSLTSRGLTNNDNATVSHYMVLAGTPNFIDLRRYESGLFPSNPFTGSGANPLQTVALMSDEEDVWRAIASLSGNLRLWSSDQHALLLTGNVGVDRFQQRNDLLFPPDLHFEPGDGLPGTAAAATSESLSTNWGASLIYTFVPRSGTYRSVTTAGFYYDESDINTHRVFGQGLAAGSDSVQSGIAVSTLQARTLERDQALAMQEEVLLLDDRLTVLGALLADRSSVNGDTDKFYIYPKASAAYRIPLPGMKEIELLRVRGAYGETGNKPAYGIKFTNLNPGNISGTNGLVLGNRLGNPDIEPERQREFEAGVDVAGYDGRGVVELTVYQRNISDLLLDRALAPSTGFTVQTDNLGSMRNRGLELMLQVTPVRQNDFSWLARSVFSLNRSMITELDVPPIVAGGFGLSLGSYQIEEGKSATQIIGNRVNEAGEIETVVVGDTEPTFRMSFVNDFSWKGFTLHTLLDWQQGSDVINLTRLLYDDGGVSADYEAERGGAWRIGEWAAGNTGIYIEDASFLKVREVSLSYAIPKQYLGQLGGMQSAQVNFSARNLLTLTGYSGLDPEVSNFGRQAIARNIDVAPYPPSRSFWFTLEAGF